MTHFHADRHVLPEPDPTQTAVTALSIDEQTAPFTAVPPIQPPSGAPNVVIVVMDDLGFGTSSAFGGPCEMPTADRLADSGLRYTRFHVTALCSPTRQALLTGRNHHSVGMGGTTEMATAAPGYNGFRPRSAATLAQILQGNGYSTAAFGKWHQTPPREISPVGPFDRWPTGEGFDHFYGFMGAEMNHWYPLLFQGTSPIEPTRRPEDGYHLSEDLADHAIDWVRTQRTLTPERPFFVYLAFGASHAPLHVAREWQDKYAGRFDHGWDRQRDLTLEQQKRLGVVSPDAELAPWADGVPHWDELSDTQRTLTARFMETFAGFTEHADHQVGRFVAALEELGAVDDTLFIYLLGDNGASGEGGIEGTTVEHRLGHGIVDDPEAMLAEIDEIGGPNTYPIAPVGWALALNTPYQWTKQVASHFGGTRDGLIVHWPAGISATGGRRHQFHHVIDVMPTVLDCAGIPHPISVGGVTQKPIEGTSMRYTFDAPDSRGRREHPVLRNVRQPRHLPRGLDGRHPARHSLGDGARRRQTLRRRPLGALSRRARLDPGKGPCRRGTRQAAAAAGHVLDRSRQIPGVPSRPSGHRAGEPDACRAHRPARRPSPGDIPGRHAPLHRGDRSEHQEPLT